MAVACGQDDEIGSLNEITPTALPRGVERLEAGAVVTPLAAGIALAIVVPTVPGPTSTNRLKMANWHSR